MNMDTSRLSQDPRYGAWKELHEIDLKDLVQHPIWVWCTQLGLPDEEDGPIGGDETSMRPVLTDEEVPMDHMAPPLILLKVQGTDHYAAGLFDAESQELNAICIHKDRDVVSPSRCDSLPEPTIYVSVPLIQGEEGVAFSAATPGADSATRIV